MFSIETINALNSGTTDKRPLGERKAKHWIEKGVRRALAKATAEVEEAIELLGKRPGWDWRAEQAEQDLRVCLNIFEDEDVIERLVASAWHRRAE